MDEASKPTESTSGATATPADESLEDRLDELQRESQERRRELLAIAAALPEVTSRRALVRSMTSSIVHAPNKPLVAKRVALKVLRQPVELWHRFR